jgi:hypothetical protein
MKLKGTKEKAITSSPALSLSRSENSEETSIYLKADEGKRNKIYETVAESPSVIHLHPCQERSPAEQEGKEPFSKLILYNDVKKLNSN